MIQREERVKILAAPYKTAMTSYGGDAEPVDMAEDRDGTYIVRFKSTNADVKFKVFVDAKTDDWAYKRVDFMYGTDLYYEPVPDDEREEAFGISCQKGYEEVTRAYRDSLRALNAAAAQAMAFNYGRDPFTGMIKDTIRWSIDAMAKQRPGLDYANYPHWLGAMQALANSYERAGGNIADLREYEVNGFFWRR